MEYKRQHPSYNDNELQHTIGSGGGIFKCVFNSLRYRIMVGFEFSLGYRMIGSSEANTGGIV